MNLISLIDVCGALISSERTLIPVERWISSPEADSERYPAPWILNVEDYASYSCYLLAKVTTILNQPSAFIRGGAPREPKLPGHIFTDRWVRLFDELKTWPDNIPPEMKPVLAIPGSPDSTINPFQTLIFSSGAAVSGYQLYHTAVLLMLQRKPRGISVESRSILWHARQICAISMSNDHHGAWTNCIQPVWLAGQLMSHPSEHQAILGLYARIEKETGWGAVWRAADLREHWGDLT